LRDANASTLAQASAGTWLPTRRQQSGSLGSIWSTLGAISVHAHDNGDLSLAALGGPSRRYVPVGGGYWRDPGSGDELIVVRAADGNPLILSGTGLSGFERASWSVRWVTPVFIAAALLGLLAAFGLGRRLLQPVATRVARPWPVLLMDLAAIAWMLGVVGVLVYMLRGVAAQSLQFDFPGPLPVFMWTITLACVLSAASAVLLAGQWRRARRKGVGRWRLLRQAGVAVVLVTASALAALHGWLGFRH
jgi:hypothetical protein